MSLLLIFALTACSSQNAENAETRGGPIPGCAACFCEGVLRGLMLPLGERADRSGFPVSLADISGNHIGKHCALRKLPVGQQAGFLCSDVRYRRRKSLTGIGNHGGKHCQTVGIAIFNQRNRLISADTANTSQELCDPAVYGQKGGALLLGFKAENC